MNTDKEFELWIDKATSGLFEFASQNSLTNLNEITTIIRSIRRLFAKDYPIESRLNGIFYSRSHRERIFLISLHWVEFFSALQQLSVPFDTKSSFTKKTGSHHDIVLKRSYFERKTYKTIGDGRAVRISFDSICDFYERSAIYSMTSLYY